MIEINGWEKYFNFSLLLPLLKHLEEKYSSDELCPYRRDTFKAFKLCHPKECKVVMVGMDPYPQKGVATGLLFANKKDTKSISPSLRIVKEAAINPLIPKNKSPTFDVTLESWAKQGVLMLNAALTVELGKPGSHIELWKPFMIDFLKNYSQKESGIAYLFFGKLAAEYKHFIDSSNSVFEVYHPAYFARRGQKMPSEVFDDINNYLIKQYGEEAQILWYSED